MTRSLRLLGSAVALVTIALTSVPHHTSAAPSRARAVTPPLLDLVSLELDLSRDEPFIATVTLPDSFDTTESGTAQVVITAYQRITTRAAVANAADGSTGRPVDDVRIRLTDITQPVPGQYLLAVPTEAVDRTADALQFSRPGLYPIRIALVDGGTVLDEFVTFVHRLPDEGTADADVAALSVATAVSTDPTVRFREAAGDQVVDVLIDDDTLAQYEQLAALLEASPVPIAVRVPPAVLSGISSSGATDSTDMPLAERLATAFDDHLVLSQTSYPLDPSAAAAAGQQSLYTQWLRDGEDAMARVVSNPSIRTVSFVDRPLSAAGGVLQRDLGTRLMVLTSEQYDALPGSAAELADTTRLVDVDVAAGVVVPAAVVDRRVATRLAAPAADPTVTAVTLVADLLAARQEIADAGLDPSRHLITIATPDLRVPELDTFLALARLIDDVNGIRPIALDVAGVRTDSTIEDQPVSLTDSVPGSIAERVGTTAELSGQIAHVRSMLPTDGDAAPTANDRVTAWLRLVGLLPTSALTDEQAGRIVDHLRSDLTDVLDAVVLPDGFAFTLTGRTSSVPIRLENTGDVPLIVQVRVSSPKLLFPDGPQNVTLEPGQFTEVSVNIEARSNGKSPVTLEVYTPDGGLRLGPPVPLSATVNALSGLGPLVTGALAIVLLTWWVRHMRQSRRTRAARAASQRHPGGGTTSTLPPS